MMSKLQSFLASAPAIFTEMVWVKSNFKTHHEADSFAARSGSITFEKPKPFLIGWQLAIINTVADLLPQIFNGNPIIRPREFMGLSQLYNTMDVNEAQNAVNVISGGGRRDLTSVYLVCWHEKLVYMAYSIDEAGDLLAAVVPRDWRYVVRIANVDGNTDLTTCMTRALLRIPTFSSTLATFYMNDDVQKSLGIDKFRSVKVVGTSAISHDEKRV